MKFFKRNIPVLTTLCIALTACSYTGVSQVFLNKAQYWERIDVRDSISKNTEQWQLVLNRDISICAEELKQVHQNNQLRNAFPADFVPEDPQIEDLAAWDAPSRKGYLRLEPTDYNDFETCMYEKGWERTEYLPRQERLQAQKTYKEAVDERLKPVEEKPKGSSYLNF